MTERAMAAIVTGIVTELRAQMTTALTALETRTAALEQRTPRDGADGRVGTDGLNGTNGRDGVNGRYADPAQLVALQARLDSLQAQLLTREMPSLEALRLVIDGAVAHALAAVPKAKDGVSVTGALLNPAGHLVLTRNEGPPIDVGLVTGAPGAAGPPGTHGKNAAFTGAVVLKRLSERSVQWCWDDGTPVEIRDAAGQVASPVLTLPALLYRGVWLDGSPYEEGDVVTHDGSLWIAKAATTRRPGDGQTEWQMAVRRGVPGPKGKPGEPGPAGRDLTQMDYDGRKW